jgi:hypothetical protein
LRGPERFPDLPAKWYGDGGAAVSKH